MVRSERFDMNVSPIMPNHMPRLTVVAGIMAVVRKTTIMMAITDELDSFCITGSVNAIMVTP